MERGSLSPLFLVRSKSSMVVVMMVVVVMAVSMMIGSLSICQKWFWLSLVWVHQN